MRKIPKQKHEKKISEYFDEDDTLMPSLGSNLFSDKVFPKIKHLRKISFSNYIWFTRLAQAKVLIVFVHHLMLAENE